MFCPFLKKIFFGPRLEACGILVPWPGIKPVPLALKSSPLDHQVSPLFIFRTELSCCSFFARGWRLWEVSKLSQWSNQREKADIGPGTKMLFVLSGKRGEVSCLLWALAQNRLGLFCVVGPLTSKILKAPVPCLVFLTSPFVKYWEVLGRIGLPCWVTVSTALHNLLGIDGVRTFLGGRVIQGAGQCSSITGRYPEGGITQVPRHCVLGGLQGSRRALLPTPLGCVARSDCVSYIYTTLLLGYNLISKAIFFIEVKYNLYLSLKIIS